MWILALVLSTALPAAQPVCVTPDGTRVKLELALTDKEKALGLMFRDSLPANNGMLFIFDKDDVYPFWMKDTIIPLDLVWLDDQGRVVEVRAGVPPCHADPCPSYAPAKSGRAVLEVNSGFAAAHGVRAGAALAFRDVPSYPIAGAKK